MHAFDSLIILALKALNKIICKRLPQRLVQKISQHLRSLFFCALYLELEGVKDEPFLTPYGTTISNVRFTKTCPPIREGCVKDYLRPRPAAVALLLPATSA